jgi:hypothetical protein
MSLPRSARFLSIPAALAVTALGAPPALAQDAETPYAIDSATNEILRVDFPGGTAMVVNTDAGSRKKLTALASRDDLVGIHLLAVDTEADEVLFYKDAVGAGELVAGEIQSPAGLSLDGSGHAYLVGSPTGRGRRQRSQVWKLPRGGVRPGGYDSPILIDGSVRAPGLVATLVVGVDHGVLEGGDLLVLSRVGRVLRYPGGLPGRPQRFLRRADFPGDAVPTGFALAPNGDLLVSTTGGAILRYDGDGRRLTPDFSRDCGPGCAGVIVGLQGRVPHAFAPSPDGGSVRAFLIQPDGTGVVDAEVTAGFIAPAAVGIASSSAAPTPRGQKVSIRPAPEVRIDFDDVTEDGLTTARVLEFLDNRTGSGEDQRLLDFFPPSSPLRGLLPDVVVPGSFQAFRKKDPVSGPPTFVMALIDTTARFNRTFQFHGHEDVILGHQPPCPNDAVPSQEPRTLYAADADDPPPVEGGFVEISSGCGSNKGHGWNFSAFLTGRDLTAPAGLLPPKLQNALSTFDASRPFIVDTVESTLNGQLTLVQELLTSILPPSCDPGSTAFAIQLLNDFIATIDGSPIAFDNATRNVSGELIARAESLLNFIPKVCAPAGFDAASPKAGAARAVGGVMPPTQR